MQCFHNVFLVAVDLRRRIELIQDFSMPVASTGIRVSADGQYILASGQCFYMVSGSSRLVSGFIMIVVLKVYTSLE